MCIIDLNYLLHFDENKLIHQYNTRQKEYFYTVLCFPPMIMMNIVDQNIKICNFTVYRYA